jgi:hypothetical protein
MTVPALGRSLSVGQLYDVRNDEGLTANVVQQEAGKVPRKWESS